MALSDDDRAALSAYLDGELDEEATHRMEVRLTLDPEFRHEYDTLRQTWSLLDFLPQASTSSTFTSRTMERLTVERRASMSSSWIRKVGRRVPVAVGGWAMGILVAGYLGMQIGTWVSTSASTEPVADEDAMVRYLPIVERLPLYQNVPDIEFLRKLDESQLFSDDSGY
jgi:anti-sigma factor RsiW